MWAHVLSFLLLLCCARLSHQDAPRIIACHQPENDPHPVDLYVSTFNATSGQFEINHDFRLFSCNVAHVGQLCRSHYKSLFYAVELNETVPIEEPRQWFHKTNGTTVVVTAKKFECKATSSAVDFPECDGGWTDKLQSPLSCLPEELLMQKAASECGKKPINSSLGGQCGDPQTYLELTFVCDNPLSVAPIHQMLEAIGHLKLSYRNEAQFVILDSYAKAAEQLMQTDRNDKELFARRTEELQNLRSSTSHLVSMMEMPVGAEFMGYGMGNVLSRRLMLQSVKGNMGMYVMRRKTTLFNMAAFLLTNMTLQFPTMIEADQGAFALKGFNVDEFFDEHIQILGPFPENEEELRKYYIEYCKNNTLGIAADHLDFLSEPNAHVKLIEMYEEIFNPGLINRKYLPKPASVWIYVCLIVAFVGLIAVAWVVCFVRKDRNYDVSAVLYSRFGKRTDNGDKNGLFNE